MIYRSILFLSLFLSIITMNAVDFGFKVGHSSFRYAEVGENSKDDLYSLDSVTLGLSGAVPLSFLDIKGTISAQLPYDFTFADAFGKDEKNYLDDLFYFGLNTNLSFGYQFLNSRNVDLSIAILLSYDYFYFQDQVIEPGSEFLYSILGAGSELTAEFPLRENIHFELNGAYIFNFLPLYDRGCDFMWSDNIIISASIVLELTNEK
jgi:hypothetical protein